MADVTVVFQGWNSSNQGWGSGGWGEGLPLAAGTSQLGSVTVSADAEVSVTGVSATGSVGSASATGTSVVSVTGVFATGGVGSASAGHFLLWPSPPVGVASYLGPCLLIYHLLHCLDGFRLGVEVSHEYRR